MAGDDLGPVFRALADPTRRAVLDLLRGAPRTTGDVCAAFPRLTRFAVVKHLGVLKAAGLVRVRAEGRLRWNHLNPVPIQALYERWMRPYEALWASRLLGLRRVVEGEASAAPVPRPRLDLVVEPPASRARSPGTTHRPIRRRRRPS